MNQQSGFLASLFDFSFKEVITTKIIKFLFVVGVVFAGLFALIAIITGFRAGGAAGVFALLLSPLLFLLYVIMVRVYLELIVVLFRIADNTEQMAGKKADDA